jgi:hypothetical protein
MFSTGFSSPTAPWLKWLAAPRLSTRRDDRLGQRRHVGDLTSEELRQVEAVRDQVAHNSCVGPILLDAPGPCSGRVG